MEDGPLTDVIAPEEEAQPAAAVPSRSWRRWVEWGSIVAIALVVALLVRLFVFQTFYIPSTSMSPTLKLGDRIIVSKLSYDIHSVGRGDIVVFSRPPRENCGGTVVPDLVKRVIGLPTEKIAGRHDQIYVTGKPLAEPWLPAGMTPTTRSFGPERIPQGEFFVMGDNRTHSCDSRTWGFVTHTWIVGKVVAVIWPLGHIRFF